VVQGAGEEEEEGGWMGMAGVKNHLDLNLEAEERCMHVHAYIAINRSARHLD
jgi:hypothetical protein